MGYKLLVADNPNFGKETIQMILLRWHNKGELSSWQNMGISLLRDLSGDNSGAALTNPNGQYWSSVIELTLIFLKCSDPAVDQDKIDNIMKNMGISLFEKVAMLRDLKIQSSTQISQDKVDTILSWN